MQLVNMCSYSETFPNVPDNVISRDKYLTLIEEQFNYHKIICVDGQKGVGVSTLLAMFALRHSDDCVSFFANGQGYTNCKPDIFEESVRKQLSCYTRKEVGAIELSSDALIYKAMRTSRSRKGYLYFVLDGMDSIPNESIDGFSAFLNKWVNNENVRLLFSGKKEDIAKILPDEKDIFQTNQLFSFDSMEVRELVKEEVGEINLGLLEEFYKLTDGVASKVHFLIDKIKLHGIDCIDDLYSNNVTDLFEYEWSTLQEKNSSKLPLFLALLSFADFPLAIDNVRDLLELCENDVNELLSHCDSIIKIDNGVFYFKYPDFKNYISSQLKHLKGEVELLLISMYEKLDAKDAFNHLPALYKSANKKSKLVRYLTSENVQQHIVTERSQAALNEQCEYGFKACADTDAQAGDYFRFAVNRSASREIEKNELSDSEIEALISIGEEQQAYELAQNVFLKEEKLKSLLLIARYAKHMPDSLSKEILSQIKILVKDIRFELIPDKAIELAKLMLSVDFVEALTIIDTVSKFQKDKAQTDKLYTALSLTYNTEGEEKENSAKADILSTKIEDTGLRQMAKSMKSIMADCSIDELLEELDKLPTATSKLYFLQFWIPENKNKEGIGKVVHYANGLVIQTANVNVPKVSLINKYCTPLPKLTSQEIIENVAMIDSVTDSIKFPTVDYVDLQLTIIQAIFTYDEKSAGDRLLDLYIEIEDFEDKTLTIKCKSKLLSRYDGLGPKQVVESYLQTPLKIQNELVAEIKKQFKETAYHLRLVEYALKELVCDYRSFLDDVIPYINTKERQSRAYLLSLNEYLIRTEVLKIDWNFVDSLYYKVTYNTSGLDKLTIRIVRKLVSSEVDSNLILKYLKSNYNKIERIESSDSKCYALSNVYVWAKKHFETDKFCAKVKGYLYDSWNSIKVPLLKVEIGFQIARVLSDIPLKQEAREYVINTTKERCQLSISTYSCMSAFQESLSHYIHSLGILIRSGLQNDEDFEHLETILEQNDDDGDSMIAWARLALEFYSSGNKDKFSEIVSRHVSKDIAEFPMFYKKYVFFNVSAALFLASSDYYFSKLDEFDPSFANACLENIACYICTKYPYNGVSVGREVESNKPLDNSDCQNLIGLMRHSADDSFIFDKVEIVAAGIKNNESRISKEQRIFLYKELEDVVEKKLPMPGGISHDGYKIACLATIKSYKNPSSNDWKKESEAINKIENTADRAFLYAHIAHCASKAETRVKFLEKAFDLTQKMTSSYDRISRYDMCLIESFASTNSQKARLFARDAMKSLLADKNGDFKELQNLVDHVREHDEQTAEEMLDMIDKDPARVSYKNRLRASKNKNNKLLSAKNDLSKVAYLSNEEQMQFFGKQMEDLIKARYTVKDVSTTLSVLAKVYENPITDTSNAVTFFMENAYNKYISNRKNSSLLRSIHDSLFWNLRIAMAIAAGTQERIERINRIMSKTTSPDDMFIRKGETEKAHNLLKTWLSENPFSNLRICDPYFKTEDMILLKSFFDIIPNLNISILTHKQQYEDLEVFQRMWNSISSELTGEIKIVSVCFEEDQGKSPIHDRWWVLYDDETGKRLGRRLPSINGLGKRISEISEMDKSSINSFNQLWTDFFYDKKRREGDNRLIYAEIQLK